MSRHFNYIVGFNYDKYTKFWLPYSTHGEFFRKLPVPTSIPRTKKYSMPREDTRRVAASGKMIGGHNQRRGRYYTYLKTYCNRKQRRAIKLALKDPHIYDPPDGAKNRDGILYITKNAREYWD